MPTPYVVGRLNEVANRGNVRIEAWFKVEREADRSWSVDPRDWSFDARYIPSTAFREGTFHLPIPELLDVRPDLLVSLYESPSFLLGASAGRLIAGRSALRVLPTFDTWVERTRLKETAKHVLFRGIDAAKVPGPGGAEVAARYGIPRSRIFHVTQSVDVSHYESARDVDPESRKSGRQQRGLGGCVFIYTGRLWRGKGLDSLLDAYEELTRDTRDVSLLIVGDGTDEAHFRQRAQYLHKVHFEGFVQPSQLPGVYALADVFVFPTLGDPHGLVVEEALAAGLPVLSTSSAGDIRLRLPEGEVGYVVPPDDPESLAWRMKQFCKNPAARKAMGEAGRLLVQSRDHEAYAVDFETFVDRTLSSPARTGLAAMSLKALGSIVARSQSSRGPAPLVAGRDRIGRGK